MACSRENNVVARVVMPFASRCRHARRPSCVEGILMQILLGEREGERWVKWEWTPMLKSVFERLRGGCGNTYVLRF